MVTTGAPVPKMALGAFWAPQRRLLGRQRLCKSAQSAEFEKRIKRSGREHMFFFLISQSGQNQV